MNFELPPLPYRKEALEPYMSRETLEYHYEKHHRGYLTKLEKAIADKPEASGSLEQIIKTAKGSVYDNAAQVWNHTFFWESMEPGGGGKPFGRIAEALDGAFGSYEAFRKSFIEAGESRFGSGYVWVVATARGLDCIASLNAETPIADGLAPILTCDVWEHSYYLDHRNEREAYLETFLDRLVSWDRVEQRLSDAHEDFA